MPLIEAMAMGVAIVASDRTSIPEIVGDAGMIVDAEDESEIVSVASMVLNDYERRTSLIERGARRVQLFRGSDAAAKMVTVYETAAGMQ